jgi:hypothetical protein
MTRVCVAVVMLVLGLGCPVGGEAGVLHQALLKDTIKKFAEDSCLEADLWDECGPSRFEECMAACREEMKRKDRR